MSTNIKDDVVREIGNATGIRQTTVRRVLESFLDFVVNELGNDNRIQIDGFGIFELKRRSPRVGRNPRTGETVPIPGRIVPVFKPGKRLTDLSRESEATHGQD